MDRWAKEHGPERVKSELSNIGLFPASMEKALAFTERRGSKEPTPPVAVNSADLSLLGPAAPLISGHAARVAAVQEKAKRAAEAPADAPLVAVGKRLAFPRMTFHGLDSATAYAKAGVAPVAAAARRGRRGRQLLGVSPLQEGQARARRGHREGLLQARPGPVGVGRGGPRKPAPRSRRTWRPG